MIDLPFKSDPYTRRPPAIGFARTVACHALAALLALTIFYLSLILTSAPVSDEDARTVARAVKVLEDKGFSRETFLLRHVATFRSSNNWLNDIVAEENSYAATNFPFEIITLYPDFYTKATDDTERAMILLHEAQHLFMGSETTAYARVWRERQRLGWTQLSHGETPTFVTVELQTREYAPELFSCSVNLWNDCTESLRASR